MSLLISFIAGISLKGTEIKSIRNNKANISDAYCIFIDNILIVKTFIFRNIQMEDILIMNQKRQNLIIINKNTHKILGKELKKKKLNILLDYLLMKKVKLN